MEYQITKKHTITLPDEFVKQYEDDFFEFDAHYLFLFVGASLEKYTEGALDDELDRHTEEENNLCVLELLKNEYAVSADMDRLWAEADAAGELD